MLLLLIGAFGFTATGENLIEADGAQFLGALEVNGLDTAIHIVAGLVLLLASRTFITGADQVFYIVSAVLLLAAGVFLDRNAETREPAV